MAGCYLLRSVLCFVDVYTHATVINYLLTYNFATIDGCKFDMSVKSDRKLSIHHLNLFVLVIMFARGRCHNGALGFSPLSRHFGIIT